MICPCCKAVRLTEHFETARVKIMSEEMTITEPYNYYKSAIVCPACGVLFIPREEK